MLSRPKSKNLKAAREKIRKRGPKAVTGRSAPVATARMIEDPYDDVRTVVAFDVAPWTTIANSSGDEASPMTDEMSSALEDALDPTVLSLETTLDEIDRKLALLENRIGGDVQDDDRVETSAIEIKDEVADVEPDESFVLTDDMLARALCPTIFSNSAHRTGSMSADDLVEARKNATRRARAMLADLCAQAGLGPTGNTLTERLVRDAREIEDEHPVVAARIRIAAATISRQEERLSDPRRHDLEMSQLRLVPSERDRLVLDPASTGRVSLIDQADARRPH